jgi:hypothetical protein
MSKLEDRVLARAGARELTVTEADYVAGAGFHTNVCTAPLAATGTVTGPGDGDGCSDTDTHFH